MKKVFFVFLLSVNTVFGHGGGWVLAKAMRDAACSVIMDVVPCAGLPAFVSTGSLTGVKLARFCISDVDSPFGECRTTPLMIAAYRGHAHLVEYFISLGANPALFDAQGAQAADYASEAGHIDIEYYLRSLE